MDRVLIFMFFKDKINQIIIFLEITMMNFIAKLLVVDVFPPFTHLGHVEEIFKPLGVSLGASLESRLSPCS